MKIRNITIVISIICFALLFLIPFLNVTTSFFFYLMMYILLAGSLNIIFGYTGYMPFGIFCFFGTGTYATVILATRFNLPFLLSILFGGLFSVLLSLVISPTLRLRGAFFAITTFLVADAVRVIMLSLPVEVAGGPYGIPCPEHYNPIMGYYIMLILTSLVVFLAWWIRRSKLGFGLRAIKDQPDAAMAMGVPATKLKIIAWSISAFFPGIAGGTTLLNTPMAEPYVAFNPMMSLHAIAGLMFGGEGTIMGPILGGAAVYITRYMAYASFPMLANVIFGVLLAVTALFFPKGIVGTIRSRFPKLASFFV